MKSMVLAAGMGRRLRPLTVCWAKPALPILGRPLIEYTLMLLGRAGIRDVVVNLHHKPESIRRALSGAAGQGFHLHYSEEKEILGTAGGLKKVESLLGEETFVLVNGDTLVDVEVAEIIKSHRRFGGEATLLLRPKPAGSDYMAIGLDRDSRLVSMGGEYSSPLMFAGIWVLEPSVLERIPPDRYCRLEVELLPALMEEGKAFGFVKDLAWFDIGTPRRYLSACLGTARRGILKEHWSVEVVPPLKASSSDTVVVAGPGTMIDSSACFTGDSVLGANCKVGPNARIQRSVLWDGVLVGEGATVRNSIVAAEVRLRAGSHTENKIVLNPGKARRDVRAREVVEGHVVASIKR
jgi:NDP-sugar pyrophosphorylase family protein